MFIEKMLKIIGKLILSGVLIGISVVIELFCFGTYNRYHQYNNITSSNHIRIVCRRFNICNQEALNLQ